MTSTTTDAEKVVVFDALARLGPHLLLDNATYFTCIEAEAIAMFVRAVYGEEMAIAFLEAHAWTDDEGDLHNPDGSLRTSVIDKEIR